MNFDEMSLDELIEAAEDRLEKFSVIRNENRALVVELKEILRLIGEKLNNGNG